jgi:predicted DNA-binding protein
VPKKSGLPEEVINHWPEVFDDIDVKVVPIDYLHSIRVSFEDGKVWDIDIAKSMSQGGDSFSIEETIEEMFEEYEDYITNVDFRLDTEKIKKDIQKRTKIFLKKNK